YGVASAAWRYFGKRLDEITLAESAMLAGLPKAPGRYAPHLHADLALHRRDTVLHMIQRSGFADTGAVQQALNEPLNLAPLRVNRLSNAYANLVQQQLINRFGKKTLRRQGMSITIPYDWQAEDAAIHAVRKGILEVEQRQYYRIPVHHETDTWAALLAGWAEKYTGPSEQVPRDDEIFPALVEEVLSNGSLRLNDGTRQWEISKPRWQWEKVKAKQDEPLPDPLSPPAFVHPRTWIAGDEVWLQNDGKGGVRLSQQASVESALYSIDLQKGTVLARVGGFDFNLGDFDRVDSANRQPGSAFKPFLYEMAMQAGYTTTSKIMEAPVVFVDGKADEEWRAVHN
ncbi:MAG: transglycosylase domain-containing protein, partial [Mariprofundaceae bacterium]|nr:transglycosylase domain-containing protein [Mariprofundaceae bacterium]